MSDTKSISSFSVLLMMAVTAVIGLACFSQLKVQYAPSLGDRKICISFFYPDASARIVEAEVTSTIEGALAGIHGCTNINSVSRDGEGEITLIVGKQADIQAVRFEVASQIRNLWPDLPKQCTYPYISLNVRGEKSKPAIAFDICSSLPSKDIANFVNDVLMYPLSTLDGVDEVDFYGEVPLEWVITFDDEKVRSLGINASDIRSAIEGYYLDRMLGLTRLSGNMFGVRLRSIGQIVPFEEPYFSNVPVKRVGGRIVYLDDIASFRLQEVIPDSYYRINGLNTLLLTIGVESDVNILSVVKNIKNELGRLQKDFPDEISVRIKYDYSEYVNDELKKIYFRTFLCLLILLLFVFIVNRSWRYMAVIALTLAVNLCVSAAIYFLLGIHIHIYTLAGITVSLGIIIDNSIVMIDHWTRNRNYSVFPALISAVLTTVAALLVILLLPDRERANLTDFTSVIVINLCVSLAVAYLFVPALIDYFPVEGHSERNISLRRFRIVSTWNFWYERYIHWGVNHRWVFVATFVIAFGIPTFLLPKSFGDERNAPLNGYEKVLNKIVGWHPYSLNKDHIDKIIGSSFALFNEALSRSDFYREPSRDKLLISAGMPEGCSVQQLNEVMRSMENYLSSIDEIEMFETNITSPKCGLISVVFKPEFEGGRIPQQIKGDVISMARNFGGANWVVTGLDDNIFNNNIVTDNRLYGITLSGYNYDDLLSYGEELKNFLSENRRVIDIEIWGGDHYDRPTTEFSVSYDFSDIATQGLSPYDFWNALYTPLFCEPVMTNLQGNRNIIVESSDRELFDAWHVANHAVESGGMKMKLSEVGNIIKDHTGRSIWRMNQSYCINIKFNYIGSKQLANRLVNETVEYLNSEVLPIGYKAEPEDYGWFYENKDKYASLILLVIAIIYVICAVHFNSLRYPFAIIWMVPIAFIGAFLLFGLSNFSFDMGGFAAFVMLSGITVNAGIYLVSAWRQECAKSYQLDLRTSETHCYVRSFNKKIWPIFLTIFSTILGLIPFLLDGPREVFWFSFALGTISGLIFSIVAFVLYLPVFCIKKIGRAEINDNG